MSEVRVEITRKKGLLLTRLAPLLFVPNLILVGVLSWDYSFLSPGWVFRLVAIAACVANSWVVGWNLGMRRIRKIYQGRTVDVELRFPCSSCKQRDLDVHFATPWELRHHMELCENWPR